MDTQLISIIAVIMMIILFMMMVRKIQKRKQFKKAITYKQQQQQQANDQPTQLRKEFNKKFGDITGYIKDYLSVQKQYMQFPAGVEEELSDAVMYFKQNDLYDMQISLQRLCLLPFLGRISKGIQIGTYIHNSLPNFIELYQNIFTDLGALQLNEQLSKMLIAYQGAKFNSDCIFMVCGHGKITEIPQHKLPEYIPPMNSAMKSFEDD